MFNLEQAITEWRQRMLAAGIQTPVPLEELESHLREEIEQQVKLGMSEQESFNAGVSHMGEAKVVNAEFARAGGILGGLGHDKTTRINRVLGMIWLVNSFWSGGNALRNFTELPSQPSGKAFVITTAFVFTFIAIDSLAGIIGGFLLFRGSTVGRNIIRILAFFQVLISSSPFIQAIWHPNLFPTRIYLELIIGGVIYGAFSLATIWLLRTPRKTRLAVN